jgi:hypothetical protein
MILTWYKNSHYVFVGRSSNYYKKQILISNELFEIADNKSYKLTKSRF